MDQLIAVLRNASSSSVDPNVRQQAYNQLPEMANQNLGYFMSLCANCLARSDLENDLRQIAALTAKNQLTSNDYEELLVKHSKWKALDEQTKASIRALSLQGLAAEDVRIGSAAAQLVSAIASVDLPDGKWTEVIQHLFSNIKNSNVPFLTRASLEALGFICEEAGDATSDTLSASSGDILHAVVIGCEDRQPDEVKIAAIRALHNSLEFVKTNFSKDVDRNYIMQVVCTATMKPNKTVRVLAFQSLVRIMSLYYEYMKPYMDSALYGLTVNAMGPNEPEEVVLQAIEFWSTVCDVETEIRFSYEEQDTSVPPLPFAKTALPHIVPQLLRMLKKKEEEIDDDEWNVAKASSTCLYLLAKTVGSDIVGLVLPFVEQNIRNPEWQMREAALMAFGNILEGPELSKIASLVSQALPLIIQSISDPCVAVQDTAAWTVGVICEIVVIAIDANNIVPLLKQLNAGLSLHPRVAASCAWAINNLAENVGNSVEGSYPLAPFFSDLVTSLLSTVGRADGGEANLRITAYSALTTLVETASSDGFTVLLQLAGILIEKLDKGIATPYVDSNERREQIEEQTQICGTLTSIVRKLEYNVASIGDNLMAVFLKIFASPASRTPEILEDCIIAIGSVADALAADFGRYMDAFHPFLVNCLTNFEEHTVCLHAVGLVGDICRALGPNILKYSETYLLILLSNAQNNRVHRDVKPHILACFGDIAQAINENIATQFLAIMQILCGAAEVQLNTNNPDDLDYLNTLHLSVVEGFTGIIQVFSGPEKSAPLHQFVSPILHFIERIYRDENKTEELARAAAGLIGDLAKSCGKPISSIFQSNRVWLSQFFSDFSRSTSQETKQTIQWAQSMVRGVTSL